jgi:glycerate dehydrogenase
LELDQLLKISDIVSIHSPLNEKTNNLITLDKLKLMKPSAMIFNTGRGGIISEADLTEALNMNIIAGAGIDVFSKEPILKDNPLLHVKDKNKIILTPHIAWISLEARTLLIEKIALNIEEFMVEAGS